MKSLVILTSSLLITSTCCAMNNPPAGDNSFLLRRSAPPATQQPGVKPPQEIDLSKMSVNSRARYMTDFVAGELAAGQCSYETRLKDLEGQFKANTTNKPDTAQELNTDASAPAALSQPKHRPLGQKDRTMSASPKLQSIFSLASNDRALDIDPTLQHRTIGIDPIRQSITTTAPAAPFPVGASAANVSDDDGSEDSSTHSSNQTNTSSAPNGQNDELFDMDDC